MPRSMSCPPPQLGLNSYTYTAPSADLFGKTREQLSEFENIIDYATTNQSKSGRTRVSGAFL